MEAQKSVLQRLFGSNAARASDNTDTQEGKFSAGYLQALVQRANARTPGIFGNSGADYAKPTVGFMIANAMAMEEVLIYSHSLKHAYYKDVLRELKCPARILLDDSSGAMIVNLLPLEIRDRIKVRILPSVQRNDDRVHFLATDYSFLCGVKGEDDELSWWGDFNNPLKAKSWREHFEKLWAEAAPPPSI